MGSPRLPSALRHRLRYRQPVPASAPGRAGHPLLLPPPPPPLTSPLFANGSCLRFAFALFYNSAEPARRLVPEARYLLPLLLVRDVVVGVWGLTGLGLIFCCCCSYFALVVLGFFRVVLLLVVGWFCGIVFNISPSTRQQRCTIWIELLFSQENYPLSSLFEETLVQIQLESKKAGEKKIKMSRKGEAPPSEKLLAKEPA